MFHPQGPTLRELLEQALSSTERGYDLLAPKFDYTPFRTPDFVLEPAIAHLATLGPIDSALDVCCGTGAAMQYLRGVCRQRLVGIDTSAGMLEVARRNLESVAGPATVEFQRGDALQMPFREEFDLAVCFGAQGHILTSQEAQFIQQVHAALRTGGRFACVTTRGPSIVSPVFWLAHGFNAAMWLRNLVVRPAFIMYYLTFLLPRAARLLEEGGFRVDIHDLYPTGRLASLKLLIATKC